MRKKHLIANNDRRDLYATGAANVISLCDVNLGAEKTMKSMQMHSRASQHKDFREIFDKMA